MKNVFFWAIMILAHWITIILVLKGHYSDTVFETLEMKTSFNIFDAVVLTGRTGGVHTTLPGIIDDEPALVFTCCI